jgi:hypothetical protein
VFCDPRDEKGTFCSSWLPGSCELIHEKLVRIVTKHGVVQNFLSNQTRITGVVGSGDLS